MARDTSIRELSSGLEDLPLSETARSTLRDAIFKYNGDVALWELGEWREGQATPLIPLGKAELADIAKGVPSEKSQTLPAQVKDIFEGFDHVMSCLPYINTTGVTRLSRFTDSDKHNVTVALRMLCNAFTGEPKVPWDNGFPTYLEALPICCLSQYGCTTTLIIKLQTAGLKNVGHMKIFHPDIAEIDSKLGDHIWSQIVDQLKDYS